MGWEVVNETASQNKWHCDWHAINHGMRIDDTLQEKNGNVTHILLGWNEENISQDNGQCHSQPVDNGMKIPALQKITSSVTHILLVMVWDVMTQKGLYHPLAVHHQTRWNETSQEEMLQHPPAVGYGMRCKKIPCGTALTVCGGWYFI